MTTITLTIPDAVATDVIAALCQTTAINDASPTAAKAKQVLISFVKNCYSNYKSNQAMALITPAADITIT